MHHIQRNIHYPKSGITPIQEKMHVSQAHGKNNINTGHLLTELITHMEIGTLFALALLLRSILKQTNKS